MYGKTALAGGATTVQLLEQQRSETITVTHKKTKHPKKKD
jgi:hypothetical protein